MNDLLACLVLLATPILSEETSPNIVILLADDMGVDLAGAYGEAPSPPCTPHIDRLANSGMLFRNAWATPQCQPSRSALLTGRHSFRTGIGLPSNGSGLPLAELTLPELLEGYTSAAVGKWHLAGNLGSLHPNESGFDHFAGLLKGSSDYFQWTKTVNGVSATSNKYITTVTVDEAITAMGAMAEPWLLYVSFTAPHSPWHEPPASLCPPFGCPPSACAPLPPDAPPSEFAKAMTMAMDTEIGRLLEALDAVDPDAYVFFLGDNGTPGEAKEHPFDPRNSKGTLYEGGIHVPLIVRGPGVANAECDALVSITDLFATIAELAGVPSDAEDSMSMAPYFADPELDLRDTVYSEYCRDVQEGSTSLECDYAIRERRYKLKRSADGVTEFFDLVSDPLETTNLLPQLTVEEQAILDHLESEIRGLHGGDPLAVFPDTISTATGGSQSFALTAGVDNAGATHLLLGSLSGTTPGLAFGPVELPLNPDPYTEFTVANANTATFESTFGVLDGLGTANSTLHLPGPLHPSLAGTVFHHAFLIIGPLGTFALASNPSSLTLVP